MTRQQILFVHKSAELLENLRQIFEERGHDVLTSADTREAREMLSTESVALICLGVDPCDPSLCSFLTYLSDQSASTPLLVEVATPSDVSLISAGPPGMHVVVAPLLSTKQRVALIERLAPPLDVPSRGCRHSASDSYSSMFGV